MTLSSVPSRAREWALFLDVDGTLLEIAATPDAVRVPEQLKVVLDLASAREEGAVALISGRSVAELQRLFAPLRLPAAGLHGAEWYGVGACIPRSGQRRDHQLDWARQTCTALTARHPQLVFEDKGLAVALHYRRAPALGPLVRASFEALAVQLRDAYQLLEGKYVYELKPVAVSKGTAIEAFMRELPFRGRLPVFIGDDVTDEYGFAAVNALGGISIRVGPAGATQARYHLPDVAAVHAWLGQVYEESPAAH